MFFKYIKKEIPLISVLTILSYFIVYFYHKGYSGFWGYPEEFIIINFSSVLSVGVGIFISAFVMFISVTQHSKVADFTNKGILFFMPVVIGMFFISFLLDRYIPHLFKLSQYTFFFLTVIFNIPALIYLGVRRFLDNHERYVFLVVTVILGVLIVPYGVGWLMAEVKSPLFNSSKGFLVSRYDNNFIFGHCRMENASFEMISVDKNIELKALKAIERKQVKTCFRNASALN